MAPPKYYYRDRMNHSASSDSLAGHYDANKDRIERSDKPFTTKLAPVSTTASPQSMEIDSSSDTRKRTHTGQQSGAHQPVQQQAVSSSSVAGPAGNELIQQDMTLTGTGMGQGGAGDGNANKTMAVYSPERPMSMFGKKVSTYRKVHRFMTFAIAPAWINIDLTTPTENQRWLTTALAKIPWELPVLYLNPSEFALIPNGAHCVGVRISIVHRGNRIAFETASSATSLATLNQIQNVMVGFGLNKTGWGTDVTYTGFAAGNPMLPTAITAPISTAYDENFYGRANADPLFTAALPTHQIGIPFPLPNYWALANAVQNFGGVPPITENIQFSDGKTTIDQCVASFSYTPKFGQLKVPLKHIRTGLPRLDVSGVSLNIPVNGCLLNTTTATINVDAQDATGGSGGLNQQIENPTNDSSMMAGLYTILDSIEKSQFTKQGPWGQYQHAQIQPSVHVGVQAIPSLSSANILSPIANWTDAQADWDVVCEMDVEEHLPTKLPYATDANVPAGAVIYRTASDLPSDEVCSYAGLYPVEGIRS